MRSTPLRSQVVGIISSSKSFIRKCTLMGIPFISGSAASSESVYVRLFDVKDALSELGLA